MQSSLVVAGVKLANNTDPVRFDVYETDMREDDNKRQFVSNEFVDDPWQSPVLTIQIPDEAITSSKGKNRGIEAMLGKKIKFGLNRCTPKTMLMKWENLLNLLVNFMSCNRITLKARNYSLPT